MRQGGYEVGADDYRRLLDRDDIHIIHCSRTHRLIQDYRVEYGDSLKRGMGGGFHEG
jgi:hypothetical protein